MLEPLYLNLGQHDVLSDAEKALLAGAMSSEKYFVPGEDIVTMGSRPSFSTLILDGFAARYKVLENGGRQFTALHVAGDFVDLHAFLLRTMDHGIIALSPCHIIAADHTKLRAITEKAPHLTRLLWLDTLVDGASTASGSWPWAAVRGWRIWRISYASCSSASRSSRRRAR